jgi:hypothetical protein
MEQGEREFLSNKLNQEKRLKEGGTNRKPVKEINFYSSIANQLGSLSSFFFLSEICVYLLSRSTAKPST